MEIVAVGWERKRNQNQIAKTDLLTAKVGTFDSYSSSQAYITIVPQEEELNSITGRYQQVQKAQVAIRFNAPIVLNGNYLLRLTLDKREVAHLFFMQYADCSFEELFMRSIAISSFNANFERFAMKMCRNLIE
jgi:hypothetical protein